MMPETTNVALEQRLANIEEALALCHATIAEQTEALRTQTEMLTALWRELAKEPGPSPAVAAIQQLSQLLTQRLDQIAASVEAMAHRHALAAE